VFSFGHVCNHSDDMGRYSYRMQPTMLDFAIKKLGVALGEMMGAEMEQGELKEGWASDTTAQKKQAWREAGSGQVDEVIREFKGAFAKEYLRLSALVRSDSLRRMITFTRNSGLVSPMPRKTTSGTTLTASSIC
jgi:uncharacterized protein YdiU (UPF0061 family)